MKLRWLGVVLLCGLWGGGVQAAPPDASVVEARKHFEDGTKAFNLGEFERAISEYKAAYNAKPDPVFLYNIAQSYRLSNDLSQALFFYRSFLRNQPNTPNRKEIEERIKQLEAQIAQQKAITTSPPTTTAPPTTLTTTPPPVETPPPTTTTTTTTTTTPAEPPHVASQPIAAQPGGVELTTSARKSDKPVYKKGWFWGVVVGGVVVVGLGVGLGIGLTRGGGAPSSDLGNQKIFALQGAQ